MSDSDSFISEVNDEVRRDRLYFMLRRYGWIAGLVVILIVGGAAWSELRKAQERSTAEGLGDDVLEAMAQPEPQTRLSDLMNIQGGDPGARAIVDLLIASEAVAAEDTSAAVATLESVTLNRDVPEIYQQIAAFKMLVLQAGTMDAATRRQQLEALARPGQPLSLLAQEQLALIDVAEGDTEAAIEKFQAIALDAGVTSDLQQRALQVIVSLGGTPQMANLRDAGN